MPTIHSTISGEQEISRDAKFKTGDRVVAHTGDSETVVSVTGNLAKVFLDRLATKTIALSFLDAED